METANWRKCKTPATLNKPASPLGDRLSDDQTNILCHLTSADSQIDLARFLALIDSTIDQPNQLDFHPAIVKALHFQQPNLSIGARQAAASQLTEHIKMMTRLYDMYPHDQTDVHFTNYQDQELFDKLIQVIAEFIRDTQADSGANSMNPPPCLRPISQSAAEKKKELELTVLAHLKTLQPHNPEPEMNFEYELEHSPLEKLAKAFCQLSLGLLAVFVTSYADELKQRPEQKPSSPKPTPSRTSRKRSNKKSKR